MILLEYIVACHPFATEYCFSLEKYDEDEMTDYLLKDDCTDVENEGTNTQSQYEHTPPSLPLNIYISIVNQRTNTNEVQCFWKQKR